MANFNNNDQIIPAIRALDAYLDSLSLGADDALAVLGEHTDADAILRRLQVLLDAGKTSEAADLIRYKDPDKRWCGQAIVAFVRNGERDNAKRIIQWAESCNDIRIWHLCLMRYGESGIAHVIGMHDPIPLTPGSLTPEETSILQDVVKVIRPLIDFILAKKRVDTEVESIAVQVSLQVAFLLQNNEHVAELVPVLATRSPIPIVLARVAYWRERVEPSDLPERLRNEHSTSFECKLMAAEIEGELQGRPADAFRAAMQLIDDASSAEDREKLFAALTQIAPLCGEKECIEVERVAKTLLIDSPIAMRLFEAGTLLSEGKTKEAGDILEDLRDDVNPVWHQMYANYLIQNGEGIPALEHLKLANKQLNHPDIYRKIAETAYQYDQTDDAIAALEQLLSIQPEDTWARNNVATLYADKEDAKNAARHLKVLMELEPEEVRHQLNYASCLARSGDVEEAIEAYNAICKADRPPLRAILGRARLMRSLGKVIEAFDSLIRYKDSYWDTPAYLYELQDLGFASRNEDTAGEALHQIQRLQAEGKVSSEALRIMDIDSAVAMFKEEKEHQDRISEQVLFGKLSWPMAELGFRRVPYWGWLVRTQPIRWIADDPITRSSYAVYSTNGFNIHVVDESLSLEPIPLPERGAEIVADTSALITLHQLGLLRKAADYFGRILIPAIYVAQALEDASKLAFHQLSQKTSLEQIKQAVDSKQLLVVDTQDETSMREFPYINDYARDEGSDRHAYYLRDLATVIRGRIDDEKYERLLKIAHTESGVDAEHPQLVLGQKIVLDLTTLKTITAEGLFGPLVRAFRIHIESHAYDGVVADVHNIAAQENVQMWHSDLWKQIRNEPRFVQASYTTPKELRNSNNSDRTHVGYASCLLAMQVGAPLFVDDRVLQIFANTSRRSPKAAFGTSEFILALSKEGMITQGEAARALKQLVDWRYRFIVLSADVLKTIADQNKNAPPGQALMDIARYAQECMRDPGLLLGMEPTNPPSSVGTRLFRAWVGNITEFVMQVWADTSFSIENATELTEWAMTEFVPSLPTGIDQRRRSLTAPMLQRIILTTVILRACNITDIDRASAAIVTVSQLLGIDSLTEYLRITTGVIDGV